MKTERRGRYMPQVDLGTTFLGDVTQVCVVTADFARTVENFVQVGVSPWRVMHLGPHNMAEQNYRGDAVEFELRVGLARCGRTEWEVIEPLSGPSIHADWLATHGDGVHHVAMRSTGGNFDDRLKAAADRGLSCIQSGTWGDIRFAYLDAINLIGTYIELMDIPEGFKLPEPDAWYPHAPA